MIGAGAGVQLDLMNLFGWGCLIWKENSARFLFFFPFFLFFILSRNVDHTSGNQSRLFPSFVGKSNFAPVATDST